MIANIVTTNLMIISDGSTRKFTKDSLQQLCNTAIFIIV